MPDIRVEYHRRAATNLCQRIVIGDLRYLNTHNPERLKAMVEMGASDAHLFIADLQEHIRQLLMTVTGYTRTQITSGMFDQGEFSENKRPIDVTIVARLNDRWLAYGLGRLKRDIWNIAVEHNRLLHAEGLGVDGVTIWLQFSEEQSIWIDLNQEPG